MNLARYDLNLLVTLHVLLGERSVTGSAKRLGLSQPAVSGSLELLADDRLDFVLLPAGYQETFPDRTLFEDRWVCGVWSGNAGVGDQLSLEQYLAMDHLIFMPGPGKRVSSRPLVTPTDRNRHAVATVESFALIPFLLRGSALVALLPERLARSVAPLADIRILEPPHQVRPILQTVCWNPRRSREPAHQWMCDVIVEVANELPKGEGPATAAAP